MISCWIYEENLKPLMETVSLFIDYNFDGRDWLAISNGIRDMDGEKDIWYEYQLIGNQTIAVKIANDPGSSVVMIQLQRAPDIEEKIQVATFIFQNYRVE